MRLNGERQSSQEEEKPALMRRGMEQFQFRSEDAAPQSDTACPADSPFPKNAFQDPPTAGLRLLAPTRGSQEEENRPRTPRPAEKPLCHAGIGTAPCRVAGVPASPLPEKPSCCPRSCLRRRVLQRALTEDDDQHVSVD